MIPPPDILIRIFVSFYAQPRLRVVARVKLIVQVLFRGVPDSEMKEWESRGLVHAEMGLDWTSV
jgi:hypothetical protein